MDEKRNENLIMDVREFYRFCEGHRSVLRRAAAIIIIRNTYREQDTKSILIL